MKIEKVGNKTTHDMLLALKRKEQNDEEPC